MTYVHIYVHQNIHVHGQHKACFELKQVQTLALQLLPSKPSQSAQEWLEALAVPDRRRQQIALALAEHARNNTFLDMTIDEDSDAIWALAGIQALDAPAKEVLRASMEELKVVSPERYACLRLYSQRIFKQILLCSCSKVAWLMKLRPYANASAS
jgi:hypothetical protein